MPRPLRIPVRISLALLAVVAALLAADRILAAADPLGLSYLADVRHYFAEAIRLSSDHAAEQERGRIFENRAHIELDLRRFTYATDGHGLRRGLEYSEPPAADALRVLFLGDSVTLGWGVDDEKTWVRLVEHEGRARGGRPLACQNAGHLMYDTVQEASLLHAWGPALRPELVVLTFVLNDVQPTWEQALAQLGLATPEARAAHHADGGLAWSNTWLARALPAIHDYLKVQQDLRVLASTDPESIPPRSFYPSGWPRCEAALDDLLATCRQLGAELVVLDHAEGEIPDLAAWCERREVPHVDLNFTPEERARDVRNSAIDPHANALGNRLLADKALAGLRRLGVLEP